MDASSFAGRNTSSASGRSDRLPLAASQQETKPQAATSAAHEDDRLHFFLRVAVLVRLRRVLIHNPESLIASQQRRQGCVRLREDDARLLEISVLLPVL